MKNLLCKLGFHRPDKYRYLMVQKTRGRHKWHRNYVVCRRCGKRIATFGVNKRPPEGEAGWTEVDCRRWCEENDLLSPIYTTATRGGCWFCHNQGVGQLRLLRKNYPDLWALMLKWDTDSPVTFHADGHTVHDFDRRFQLEDDGFIYPDDKVFRWSMLDDELNYRLF